MAGAADRRKRGGGGDAGGAYWMDTYGDLVTLLLTFFVLLFAFSNIDAAKWEALVGSFTGISVMSIDPLSPDVAIQRPIENFGPKGNVYDNDTAAQEEADEAAADEEIDLIKVSIAKMYALYEHMKAFVEGHDIDAEVVLIADEYSVKMVFNDMIFFETAKADLLQESLPILDQVVDLFIQLEQEGLYETLRIEGHCDKRPINTSKYPSNWELSADRALQVCSYFRQTSLLDPSKLMFAGFGAERPLIDEETPEAYARNRRVEFHAETLPVVRAVPKG